MGKYTTAFILSWQETLQYRFEFITQIIRVALSLGVIIFIWLSVFSQTNSFGNYTLPKMITYLLLAQIIHPLNRHRPALDIAQEIKSGEFSTSLIRPYNYFVWQFVWNAATQIIQFFVISSLFFLFLSFFPNFLNIPAPSNLLLFFLLLPLIYTLSYLFNLFWAGIAFWIIDIRLFSTFIALIVNFLSGELLPLDLFPPFLQKVAYFLPFQYRTFFPISVYNNQLNSFQITKGILTMIGWIFILGLIVYKLWQKGIKKYEAVGR